VRFTMPVFLSTATPTFDADFTALLGLKREDAPDVDTAVANIIADVRARGDAAVLELTTKFDRLQLTPATMAFTPTEIDAECAKVSPEDRAALTLAADRIRPTTAARCRKTRNGKTAPVPPSAGAGARFPTLASMCRVASPLTPHPS
jgi:histidinol dehydrogenase